MINKHKLTVVEDITKEHEIIITSDLDGSLLDEIISVAESDSDSIEDFTTQLERHGIAVNYSESKEKTTSERVEYLYID